MDVAQRCITDDEMKKFLGDQQYDKVAQEMTCWENTDLNWKRYVKSARTAWEAPLYGYSAVFSLLHGGETVSERSEPSVDKDGWIQFCFPQSNHSLGKRRLFVELLVDWDKVRSNASNADQL